MLILVNMVKVPAHAAHHALRCGAVFSDLTEEAPALPRLTTSGHPKPTARSNLDASTLKTANKLTHSIHSYK